MDRKQKQQFKDVITGNWVRTLPPVIQLSSCNIDKMRFVKTIPLKKLRTMEYELFGYYKPISKIANILELEENEHKK